MYSFSRTSRTGYTNQAFLKQRIIRHRLQRRYARGGDPVVLQATRRYPKSDAVGDIVLCMMQFNLSARAYHCILKLARTIADLAGSEEIQSLHLAEALHAAQPTEVDDKLTI